MSLTPPVPMPVVPAKLRFVLYWSSYFASMAAGLISAGWQIVAAASPDVSAPLWVKLAPAFLLLVVAQLNGLSGNNVVDKNMIVKRDENGTATLAYIGAVLVALAILLSFIFGNVLMAMTMLAVAIVVGGLLIGYAATSARQAV